MANFVFKRTEKDCGKDENAGRMHFYSYNVLKRLPSLNH